jgi:hypothetical protein
MPPINEVAVYLNTMMSMVSCIQYTRTLQKASAIEYKLHAGDEGYQWIDNKSLYRLVLRLKLGIRLIMSILSLFVCSSRLFPVLLPYQTPVITYSSVLFYVCMVLDSQIMYLTYSKSDFRFLNITKKSEEQVQDKTDL